MHENGWLFYKTRIPADVRIPADIQIPADGSVHTLPAGCTSEVWCPGVMRIKANGISAFPFFVWWIFHMLHVFSNRDYGLVIVRRGSRVIHRSVITPRYFRFPFMAVDDIQVGDTWTDPSERGKGIATTALERVLRAPSSHKRMCWYVVEPDNQASIRVVEKAGFLLAGRGIRTRPFGLGILGRYMLTEPTSLAEAGQAPQSGCN